MRYTINPPRMGVTVFELLCALSLLHSLMAHLSGALKASSDLGWYIEAPSLVSTMLLLSHQLFGSLALHMLL